ncbi:hypothetical protein BJX76DRAFT_221538 [Aspergillus varians]
MAHTMHVVQGGCQGPKRMNQARDLQVADCQRRLIAQGDQQQRINAVGRDSLRNRQPAVPPSHPVSVRPSTPKFVYSAVSHESLSANFSRISPDSPGPSYSNSSQHPTSPLSSPTYQFHQSLQEDSGLSLGQTQPERQKQVGPRKTHVPPPSPTLLLPKRVRSSILV